MEIKFDCPFCHQHLESSDDMSGQLIDCPICQRTIEVPFSNISPEEQDQKKQQFLREMMQQNWEEMQKEEKRKEKRKKFIENVKAIAFVSAVVIPTLFFCAICSSSSVSNSGSSASSSAWVTIQSQCIGWRDSSEFDKSLSLAASGDTTAWETHWTRGLIEGKADSFEAGTSVHIEESGIFSGRVLVRAKGSTDAYWVPSSAVQ